MRSVIASVHLALVLFPFASTGVAQEAAQSDDDERGLQLREEGAFEGYTLFSPLLSHAVYLVDMDGKVVHEWRTKHAPAGSVYLLSNGNLHRGARQEDNPRFDGGGIGGRIQEFDWDGNLVWDYVIADDFQTAHHDTEVLPNGNVLVITWEHRFQEDAIEWGRDPAKIGENGMWPDAVLELKPVHPDGAEVVWEWHAWDHTVQDFDPDKSNHGSVSRHAELIDINYDHRRPPISEEEQQRLAELEEQMKALGYVGGDEEDDAPGSDVGGVDMGNVPDWMHTNAVDYDPVHDLIVLSSPDMDEIFVIDHSLSSEDTAWNEGGRWGMGGALLWRWGNPKNYGAGTEADRRLFYQHDPTFIEGTDPNEIRILVYNNGGGRPDGDYSSVEELVLPFDPEKGFVREAGAFGPAQPAWSYSAQGEFFSGFISGAQRLENGNTLICAGAPGRVFEVTPDGEIVWEYLNPFGGEIDTGQGGNAPPTALFRATRIAPDHPGLAGRL